MIVDIIVIRYSNTFFAADGEVVAMSVKQETSDTGPVVRFKDNLYQLAGEPGQPLPASR